MATGIESFYFQQIVILSFLLRRWSWCGLRSADREHWFVGIFALFERVYAQEIFSSVEKFEKGVDWVLSLNNAILGHGAAQKLESSMAKQGKGLGSDELGTGYEEDTERGSLSSESSDASDKAFFAPQSESLFKPVEPKVWFFESFNLITNLCLGFLVCFVYLLSVLRRVLSLLVCWLLRAGRCSRASSGFRDNK
jgi:hypothetical protein